jgi:hypothetical protein
MQMSRQSRNLNRDCEPHAFEPLNASFGVLGEVGWWDVDRVEFVRVLRCIKAWKLGTW